VDSFVKKLLSLLKKCTSEDDNTSGAISDFIVLRLGELDQKSGSLMLHFHFLDNSGTVVCDNDIAIRAIY